VDHVIEDSAYNTELLKEAARANKSKYEILNEEILKLEKEDCCLTKDYHLLGYFHGNRSPRANPNLKGMISGISSNLTKAELCKKYLSAIQSVALGTRHIIESLNAGGYNIKNLHMCGGGTKNPIWLREHADSTGCEINLPKEQDAVLLGSAILAASAAGLFPSAVDAMRAMSVIGEKISPRTDMKSYYDKKYKIFLEMYEDQMKYKKIIE
jgi:ribulose kinase